jgi:hypothetical protein
MAAQQLATIEDWETFASTGASFPGLSDAQKDRFLAAASSELLGYLSQADAAPLAAYGDDLRSHVVAVAQYRAMVKRGFNASSPIDVSIRLGRDDAIMWAKDVAKGLCRPPDIIDATPDIIDDGADGAGDEDSGSRYDGLDSTLIL